MVRSRMKFAVPSWETYEAGAEAAEEIAKSLGVELAKAGPRILSTNGYAQAVRTLVRALAGSVRTADKAATLDAAAQLDADWPTMTAAERLRVIASASKSILGVPELIIGKVEKTLTAHMTQVVKIAKRETVKTYRMQIQPSFTTRDERIIDVAAKSQGNYITDRYRNRAETFTQKAREIVSKGLGDGLGRKEIGALLRENLTDPSLRNTESYWETIASIHTTRARSWGQLSSFQDGGIDFYEWESVLDEVTSDQCRWLHGKRFEVAKAVASFEAVEAAGESKAIEKLQPWVRLGRTSDGEASALFVDRGGGSRKMLAQVDASGVGESDKIGSYSKDVGAAALQKLGVGVPPAHPRCRSTIVPS